MIKGNNALGHSWRSEDARARVGREEVVDPRFLSGRLGRLPLSMDLPGYSFPL